MKMHEEIAHHAHMKKHGGKLSYKRREKMPKSSFALGKSPANPAGRYPISDISHARNALARVAQFGSDAEKAKVRAAVHRRYPQIKSKGE